MGKLKPDLRTAGGHARFSKRTLDQFREAQRKKAEPAIVSPEARAGYVYLVHERPYPESRTLKPFECKDAVYTYRHAQPQGLIPKARAREFDRIECELIRAAEKMKLKWLKEVKKRRRQPKKQQGSTQCP